MTTTKRRDVRSDRRRKQIKKQINWNYITPKHELEWLLCGFILVLVNILGAAVVTYMFPW